MHVDYGDLTIRVNQNEMYTICIALSNKITNYLKSDHFKTYYGGNTYQQEFSMLNTLSSSIARKDMYDDLVKEKDKRIDAFKKISK